MQNPEPTSGFSMHNLLGPAIEVVSSATHLVRRYNQEAQRPCCENHNALSPKPISLTKVTYESSLPFYSKAFPSIVSVLLALSAQSCSVAPEQTISVKADIPHTSIKYLDQIEWAQRSEFGRAYSDWAFFCKPILRVKELNELGDGNKRTFEVTGVNITLQLELTETLPYGVKDPLRKHEDTHCKMTTSLYQQGPAIATEIAQSMIGKKIIVDSIVDENAAKAAAILAARTDITSAYKKRLASRADEVAVIFDRITNHGMNGVTNEDGSKKAFEELDQKQKEGEKKNGA